VRFAGFESRFSVCNVCSKSEGKISDTSTAKHFGGLKAQDCSGKEQVCWDARLLRCDECVLIANEEAKGILKTN
jgi:hypothetical protein